jgi:hypothetical protein
VRTTVTLDPDVEQLLRARMKRRKVSFKRALNDSIREANRISHSGTDRPVTTTRSMGLPAVDIVHALRLAADLEDAELIAKMQRGA